MTPAGKQRLWFALFVVLSLSGAVGLSLYALQDNIAFFHSPHDIAQRLAANDPAVATGRRFRLGGLVKPGSIARADADSIVRFVVMDYQAERAVEYKGIPPDLFREGQGVVATGALRNDGVFAASELLARHDENYMPPDVAAALEKSHRDGAAALKEAVKERPSAEAAE